MIFFVVQVIHSHKAVGMVMMVIMMVVIMVIMLLMMMMMMTMMMMMLMMMIENNFASMFTFPEGFNSHFQKEKFLYLA